MSFLYFVGMLFVAYAILVMVLNQRHPCRLTGKNMAIGMAGVFFCGYFGLVFMLWLLVKKPEAWPADPQPTTAPQPNQPAQGNTP